MSTGLTLTFSSPVVRLNCRDDPVYARVVDIEMSYQSKRGILLADQDSLFLQVHTQGFQILFLWLDKYHVGEALDRQAFDVNNAFGKSPGPVMIIG